MMGGYTCCNDGGTVSAFNAKTGALLYERQKLPGGMRFTASPWACNGRIFCLNEDGVTFVVGAGDRFDFQQTNKRPRTICAWPTPPSHGDQLLIGARNRIYCIGKKL